MSEEKGAMNEDVIVQVMKYDGALHRRWQASLVARHGSLLIFDAAFSEEVRHSQLGLIERGTVSLEYYWLNRWYNVFRFQNTRGALRNFYCNVNMPPAFDGRTLTYVDLDIDIVVAPDLSYSILDRDEFEQNALRYKYPREVIREAERALSELISMIEARRFPFDISESEKR